MIQLPEKIASRMSDLYRRGEPFLFVINYAGDQAYLWRLSEVPADRVMYDMAGKTNRQKRVLSFGWRVLEPVSWQRYREAFERVQEYQRKGENYLLNLTFPTRLEVSHDIWEVASALRAPYVLTLRGEFVVFSPETFVVIEDGVIATFPMKGTIPATCEESLALLYEDQKEQAEHIAIVDLLRNDLGQVCERVEVKRYRYWEKVHRGEIELYQTSSHIEGTLRRGIGIGEVFECMLPAGSVTGVPKKRAVEIIQEVEGYQRGWYTGICGLFDGRRLMSAVMIRYMEYGGREVWYKSGGGVMVYSDARREYQELLEKIYVPIL